MKGKGDVGDGFVEFVVAVVVVVVEEDDGCDDKG